MPRITFILLIILIMCLPIIPTTYEVVEWEQVEEQFTIMESYTTTEDVNQPYTRMAEVAEWKDDGSWDNYKNSIYFTVEESIQAFQAVTPGRWEIKYYPVVKRRTVSKPVTKYREVTKTRLVNEPKTIQQRRLISVLQKLLGG